MAKKTSVKKVNAKTSTSKSWKDKICSRGSKDACKGGSGCLYGLGIIGALVYYLSTATGFWVGVWGVVKALLWPAFLVYELLRFINM